MGLGPKKKKIKPKHTLVANLQRLWPDCLKKIVTIELRDSKLKYNYRLKHCLNN